MATLTIIYWRDIPTQVVAREGRVAQKRELPERFIQAVDRAAMRAGLFGSDDYLSQWRRSDPQPCGPGLAAEADAAAAALEAEYDDEKLRALVAAEGRA